MKRRVTYRLKFIISLTVAFLLGLFIYRTSISRTLEERRTNRELSARISWLRDVRSKLAGINEASFISYDTINNGIRGNAGSHERMLAMVSGYSNSNPVKLIEFPSELVYEKDQLIIRTSQFTCSGSFSELLKLLEFLERDKGTGKIRSADFFMFTDRRSGVSSLRLRLSVENVTQKPIQ